MSVGDLAKACRQDTWTEHVVPAAIEALRRDPLAGELYEGELVVAQKSIPQGFWLQHGDLAAELRSIVERALLDLDPQVQRDARELLSRLP